MSEFVDRVDKDEHRGGGQQERDCAIKERLKADETL